MQSLLPGAAAAPNLHPLLVHFPVALWLTALLFWVIGALSRNDRLLASGRWLLYLGTLSGVAAVASGFLAADQMGHDAPGHEYVHIHRDYMLVATGLMIGVTVGALWTRRWEGIWHRWVLLGGLLIANAVAAMGADRGALLVFGYRMGTAERPPEIAHAHGHAIREVHELARPESSTLTSGSTSKCSGAGDGRNPTDRACASEAAAERAAPAPPEPTAPAAPSNAPPARHDHGSHSH